MIICGDLNARTGKENYIINDPLLFDKEKDDKDELIFERNSDDGEINLFGRQLLEVCKMFALFSMDYVSGGSTVLTHLFSLLVVAQ